MIQKSTFKPAWWLHNPHLQTLWAPMFRRQPEITTRKEQLDLPDGDFLDLHWYGEGNGPIVVLLHGLGGSLESHYAKGMLKTIAAQGWRGVFMHFRGASDRPNRLPRHHHSGDTEDVQTLVEILKQREPNTPVAAIGFSVGGNVLLKWLGETGANNPLVAAVAVSVPFELLKAANHINSGMTRFYQWYILRDVRDSIERKLKVMKLPIEIASEDLQTIKSFWDFDDQVTAPLHGFADVYDYYTKASSRQFLKRVEVPTLVIHSTDDPFMSKDVLVSANELSAKLILELSEGGGHVGFVAGSLPWKPVYWLENRIPAFFQQVFQEKKS